MITYMGYIALFFCVYNILSGILVRAFTRTPSSDFWPLEASIWFVSAYVLNRKITNES